MHRLAGWAILVTAPSLLCGAVVWPPSRGFEQNVGQYTPEVLFALDQQILYRNRIEVSPGLSIEFANENPAAMVVGKNPAALRLNLFLGVLCTGGKMFRTF